MSEEIENLRAENKKLWEALRKIEATGEMFIIGDAHAKCVKIAIEIRMGRR